MSELAQRAVVLQALRDDHGRWWSRAELESALPDVAPPAVAAAVAALGEQGVLELDGERLRAGRAALRLDALGLIAV